MMSRSALVGALVALVTLLNPAQGATLLGDSIATDWNFPTSGTHDPTVSETPANFTVGAGVETTFVIENRVSMTADFSDSSLVLKITSTPPGLFFLTAAQNGPVFSVLAGNPFPSILSTTTSNGGTVSASILAGELFVNFSGWVFGEGDNVTVAFAGADTLTPLPATLPLFAGGLSLLGLFMRRNRRGNAA